VYSFRSIKGKIVLWSGLCLAASILVIIAYTTYTTRQEALKDALRQAEDQATVEALKIKSRFEVGLDAARTLAQSYQGMRETNQTPSRDEMSGMLRTVAAGNEALLGAWTVWEPDALDGADAAHKHYDKGHDSTGRFVPYWNKVGGLHLEPCGDSYLDPERAGWYLKPLRSTTDTVSKPVMYNIGGKRRMVVTLGSSIRVNGRPVGAVGVDLPVDFLQQIADSMTLLGTRAMVTLVSHAGTIAAQTDKPDLAGKQVTEVFTHPDKVLRSLARNEVYRNFSEGYYDLVVPVTLGSSSDRWGVGISVPEKLIYEQANAMALHSALIGGGCLLLAVIVLWVVAGIIARPLKVTAAAVNSIAEGDLDVRLDAEGRDEVAGVQSAVNVMAEKLHQNMADIERQMGIAEEKSRQAEHATQVAEEARQQAEKAKAEGMLQAAEKLERVVERISTAMEEISAQSEEMRKGTELQRDRVQSTSTAMEEMNATVLEVAQNAGDAADHSVSARDTAREGQDVVGKSIDAMATTKRQTERLRSAMDDLDSQAKGIGNIMNVIEDIADQTNLLALNAAIEAARAGEAGRGFAVVADEVRKLAEKTMTATKEVGSSIESIQKVAHGNIASMETAEQDLERAVAFANKSGEVLEKIVMGVEASSGQIQGIATAAGQQSAASDEINRSIEEINQITNDTAQSVEETVLALREMAEQSSGLASLIRELKDDSQASR
jgi:methyl-accepting chemotaxis protein